MPRAKLANVSVAALQAEIQRRLKKAHELIAQRDVLDRQIAELQAVAGPGAKRGPKPKLGRPPGPQAKQPRRRRRFRQTAEQMILGLLKGGKSMTTAEINATWRKQGRGASADTTLSNLAKVKKIKREKIPGAKGSNYSLT